jgi:hypothetical protein
MPRNKAIFIPLLGVLVLLFILPFTAFAQDIRPQAIISGSVQQGNWYEQWNQTGTMYCPNNRQRFVSASNEAFVLSAPPGEAILSVAYQTSRQTIFLARSSYGTYVYTSPSNQWVQLLEASVISSTQMSVTSTFYAKDGSCTLVNYATWSFTGSPQPQPQPQPQTCTVRANGVTVNKRIGPGLNYTIVGKLPPNTTATVISVGYDNQGSRWWFLADNTWVSGAFTIATGNCPQ